MGMTRTTGRRGLQVTDVLEPRDVVDDEVLHPGSLVWLGTPRLGAEERARFRRAARAAAMALHPAGRTRLRIV